jgi:hypothetical protein
LSSGIRAPQRHAEAELQRTIRKGRASRSVYRFPRRISASRRGRCPTPSFPTMWTRTLLTCCWLNPTLPFMDRREWMRMSTGYFAALVGNHAEPSFSRMLDAAVRDATDAFDHILLGAPDLDVGIRWVEERTGVRAKFGGNHPVGGTRNALLSLGIGHYLEIIAPDPAQSNVSDVRELAKLSSPRLIHWAIHTEDIAAAKSMVEAAGIKTVGPKPGSRQRPDGKLLHWQTLGMEQTTPLVPFFIQWEAGSPHPSSDSPQLGTVKSLYLETPQPDELRRILHAAALQGDIRKSSLPRIVLVVQTPRGEIEMS